MGKGVEVLLEEISDRQKKRFGEVVPISPLPDREFLGFAKFRFPTVRIRNDEERQIMFIGKEVFSMRASAQIFYFKTGFFAYFAFRTVEDRFADFKMSASETVGARTMFALTKSDKDLSTMPNDNTDADSYGVHIKGMKAGSDTLLWGQPE